jgi:hypothetical protein
MLKKFGNLPVNVGCQRVELRRHLLEEFVEWRNHRMIQGGVIRRLQVVVGGSVVLLCLLLRRAGDGKKEMLKIRRSCGMIRLVVLWVLRLILVPLEECHQMMWRLLVLIQWLKLPKILRRNCTDLRILKRNCMDLRILKRNCMDLRILTRNCLDLPILMRI